MILPLRLTLERLEVTRVAGTHFLRPSAEVVYASRHAPVRSQLRPGHLLEGKPLRLLETEEDPARLTRVHRARLSDHQTLALLARMTRQQELDQGYSRKSLAVEIVMEMPRR